MHLGRRYLALPPPSPQIPCTPSTLRPHQPRWPSAHPRQNHSGAIPSGGVSPALLFPRVAWPRPGLAPSRAPEPPSLGPAAESSVHDHVAVVSSSVAATYTAQNVVTLFSPDGQPALATPMSSVARRKPRPDVASGQGSVALFPSSDLGRPRPASFTRPSVSIRRRFHDRPGI